MNLIARYISTAIAGAVLMMWGVINFTVQFNQWRQGGDAELALSWTWSWGLSAVASLLPFVFGLLLLKSVFASQPMAKSTAKSTVESTGESQI